MAIGQVKCKLSVCEGNVMLMVYSVRSLSVCLEWNIVSCCAGNTFGRKKKKNETILFIAIVLRLFSSK